MYEEKMERKTANLRIFFTSFFEFNLVLLYCKHHPYNKWKKLNSRDQI